MSYKRIPFLCIMGNKEGKHSKSGDASHFSGHPKLKKADLEFLKANTSFDEETITEWYTEFLVSSRKIVPWHKSDP